mmetsp:Transcript_24558/g.56149  ORF Transcript_24558/g.56149 Transcript_24558/m.56149 type:complete len:338 (-) Transcript_24558:1330-2343(-)
MTGGHIDLDANGPGGFRVRLVTDLRSKLGGLPVLDPRVVEASRQQTRWISGPRSNVVDGGVFHHVLVVLFLVGVSPLLPLDDGQRDGGVDHGGNDVHEGNSEQRRPKQFGSLVDGRADQQSSGRSSLAAELLRGGDLAVLGEPPGHVDEVVEGVLLAQVLGSLGFLVPLASHLAASAHVSDDVHHAPVEESPAGDREGRLHAVTVGSVSVQMGRNGGALPDLVHGVRSVHDADGNLGLSVAGTDRDAFAGVLGLIVSGNLLFLENRSRLRVGRSVERNLDAAGRGDEGAVGHHDGISRVPEVGSQSDVEGVFVELEPDEAFHVRRGFVVVADHPDLR